MPITCRARERRSRRQGSRWTPRRRASSPAMGRRVHSSSCRAPGACSCPASRCTNGSASRGTDSRAISAGRPEPWRAAPGPYNPGTTIGGAGMALFDRSALNPGVRGREVFAWSMYDFANSGYTTVVLTAVFNAYFVGVVAGNAAWATFAWTAALALSSMLVIFTAPGIGARGDRRGDKKAMLAIVTVVCVVATSALGLIGPGDVAFALLLVVVSNYCYVIGDMLIAAFLPELARPAALGRVSGWGWSFGYFGGMLTLGLSLAWVLGAQKAGAGAAEFVPVTMWITAAVYALAAIPVFLLLRERAGRSGGAPVATATLGRIRHYWRRVREFDDFVRLLACGFFYQAG